MLPADRGGLSEISLRMERRMRHWAACGNSGPWRKEGGFHQQGPSCPFQSLALLQLLSKHPCLCAVLVHHAICQLMPCQGRHKNCHACTSKVSFAIFFSFPPNLCNILLSFKARMEGRRSKAPPEERDEAMWLVKTIKHSQFRDGKNSPHWCSATNINSFVLNVREAVQGWRSLYIPKSTWLHDVILKC